MNLDERLQVDSSTFDVWFLTFQRVEESFTFEGLKSKTSPRYLTKSRFIVGWECPTKLYYAGRPEEFANSKLDDKFLQALAYGGFQVGALAQLIEPAGVLVETLDYEESIKQTHDLLQQENVTIFEAAIRYQDYFIRADILKKRGNVIELIEVKAKSFDEREDQTFFNKTKLKSGEKALKSDWEPYLLDVAFQTQVIRQAYPNFEVRPYLMMANKRSVATADGFNQFFIVSKDERGRTAVTVTDAAVPLEDLRSLLFKKDVSEYVDFIFSDWRGRDDQTFGELSQQLASSYRDGVRIPPVLTKDCRSCEFRVAGDNGSQLKSGHDLCWTEVAKVTTDELHKRPPVYKIWKIGKTADLLIANEKYFADEILPDELKPKDGKEPVEGLSEADRKWLQVQSLNGQSNERYVAAGDLRRHMDSWVYPLHMIDFETSSVAIPFHQGMGPYQQIAFQFSHHVIEKDGTVRHAGEYLNAEHGEFPNFHFVRALKKQLENDSGTIFRYHNHENTVLCAIRRQLLASDVFDRDELVSWIETITKSGKSKKGDRIWQGDRCMVDMWELTRKFYYHPAMGGSISLKQLLPAVLNDSKVLREKYSKPVYGLKGVVRGTNFGDHFSWIKLDAEGRAADPYDQLESPFAGYSDEALESFMSEDEELNNGAAAMMAWAKMQFTQMPEAEREAIRKALLRYCELDTMAMVMVYEYWREVVG